MLHTPGPWSLPSEFTPDDFDGSGKIGIYAHDWQEEDAISSDGEEIVICDVTEEDSGRYEAVANAVLIAAAPTLLAICERLLTDCRVFPSTEHEDELRRAVKLAKEVPHVD